MRLYIFIILLFFTFSSLSFAQDENKKNNLKQYIILNIKSFCTLESKCFIAYNQLQNALPNNISKNIKEDLKVNSFKTPTGESIKFFLDRAGIQYFTPPEKNYKMIDNTFICKLIKNNTELKLMDNLYERECELSKPHIIRGLILNRPLEIYLHIFWYELISDDRPNN